MSAVGCSRWISAYARSSRQSAAGFPDAVEPNASYRTVVGEQLGELPIQEIEITIPVAALGSARELARVAAWKVIRVMPVELRVIEEQFQSLKPAFIGELFHGIAMERRPIDDVVRRGFGGEHRESVVMPRGDGDVSNAGGLCRRDPLARVEFHGVECRREPLVGR